MTTVNDLLAAGARVLADATPAADVVEMRRRSAGGELVLQRCARCGYLRYPPAPLCPECLSRDAGWVTDSGAGEIWSFCVYRRAFTAPFADLVPYVVALVVLDSGPELITNVADSSPDEIRVGLRGVAAPWALPDGQSLIYFTVTEQTRVEERQS
ncbi:MAG: hypothetical protein GEU93_12140 [Propionibacteriales bacterium]|nr:hypothetical protein [Propionibacteriales bacterium]